MQKEKDEPLNTADDTTVDSVEIEISNFAEKIGEETNNKYFVYLYRLAQNEESGRKERLFLRRYEGIGPDPQDIADRYRGGKYLITFVWKARQGQKTKSYTVDIDPETYPSSGKEPAAGNQIVSLANTSGLSDSMKFQLVMLQTIGDVMKAAYQGQGTAAAPGHAVIDPMEQFSGVLQAMENNYSSLMNVQSKMFERVLSKNMEIQYGLSPESPVSTAGDSDESGIMGKYGPLIKELVGSLKIVLETFGNRVPKEIVKRVQGDDRFKELRQNPKALIAIGQTLRQEFGKDRAAAIMKDFGVRVEYIAPQQVKTPDIPLPAAAKVGIEKNGGNGKVVTMTGKKGVPGVSGKV